MAASADIAGKLGANTTSTQLSIRAMQHSGKGPHPKSKAWARQSRSWRWVTERGLRVETGAATLARFNALVSEKFAEVETIIPADDSLLVVLYPGAAVSKALQSTLAAPASTAEAMSGRIHEIPVVYGAEAGPDLRALAARTGMSERAFIAAHASTEYTVAFLGFQPGFAYLRGLPEALQAPRRTSPRTRVPAGSLAIGGAYTGIYPASGPGGWQIIGRADAVLFDAERAPPALFAPGDRVRFAPQ
jgi:KipI family sensor histidine kinase inhibitor